MAKKSAKKKATKKTATKTATKTVIKKAVINEPNKELKDETKTTNPDTYTVPESNDSQKGNESVTDNTIKASQPSNNDTSSAATQTGGANVTESTTNASTNSAGIQGNGLSIEIAEGEPGDLLEFTNVAPEIAVKFATGANFQICETNTAVEILQHMNAGFKLISSSHSTMATNSYKIISCMMVFEKCVK